MNKVETGRLSWIIQAGPTRSHESLEVESHFFFPAEIRERERLTTEVIRMRCCWLWRWRRETQAKECGQPLNWKNPGNNLSPRAEHNQKPHKDYIACLTYLICFLAVWLPVREGPPNSRRLPGLHSSAGDASSCSQEAHSGFRSMTPGSSGSGQSVGSGSAFAKVANSTLVYQTMSLFCSEPSRGSPSYRKPKDFPCSQGPPDTL